MVVIVSVIRHFYKHLFFLQWARKLKGKEYCLYVPEVVLDVGYPKKSVFFRCQHLCES